MWHYEQGGSPAGPVGESELLELLHSGVIQPGTLVWREGFPDWVRLDGAGLDLPPPPGPPAAEPAEPAGGPRRLRLAPRAAATVSPAIRFDPPAAEGPPAGARPFLAGGGVSVDPGFHFDGNGAELLKLYLKNILFTVLTLGVYRFWAQVATRRYLYQHVRVRGGRFDYHASGRERFIGFLKGLVLLLPVAGAGVHLYYRNLSRGREGAAIVAVYGGALLMGLLRPMILVGSRRFNLSRTSWNSLRFRFDGTIAGAYALYLKDILLTLVTFGFYWAWHQANVKRFEAVHARMGDTRFDYTGGGGDILMINLSGYLLSTFTFGLYSPWWTVKLRNDHLDNTRFGAARLASSLTGGQLLGFWIVSLFTVVLSAGLAFPWVVARWHRLKAATLHLHGPINIAALGSSLDPGGSALADGLTEAAEAADAIGSMFT